MAGVRVPGGRHEPLSRLQGGKAGIPTCLAGSSLLAFVAPTCGGNSCRAVVSPASRSATVPRPWVTVTPIRPFLFIPQAYGAPATYQLRDRLEDTGRAWPEGRGSG